MSPAIIDATLKVVSTMTKWKEMDDTIQETETLVLANPTLEVTVKAHPHFLEGIENGLSYKLHIFPAQKKLPLVDENEI